MADVRPFRALRYDPARVDPALAIAPPYDVISSELQRALYGRSPHNIIRIEYGEQSPSDTAADNRYTRAAADLAEWREVQVLTRPDPPTFYVYDLRFDWEGRTYSRKHVFGLVRLEEWDKGVIKPHEHTLSGPKQDRLELLRATRTQISPVYCLYRSRNSSWSILTTDVIPYNFEADGQHHTLSALTQKSDIDWLREMFADSDFYIADGHHRYETALAYRNECRAAVSNWTGEEPENFVLMAMTEAFDPGLLVLPTHRLVHRQMQAGAIERIKEIFDVDDIGALNDEVMHHLAKTDVEATAFVALGLEPGRAHLLTLNDWAAAEASMPKDESAPWKRLDVNVLQYAILQQAFGIDDTALKAGGAVTYIQNPREAAGAVEHGTATAAFLLNATPVDQVIAVSDVDGRMPQKSTYFYPKLPTGLVINPLTTNKSDGPRISVALCTFNGARFLREQLDSIAAQRLPPAEVIASDDASTDDTVAILESFAATAPFPMHIHRNERTVGATQNFAQAIALCKGDFIALADQDDVWRPDKLESLHRALVQLPGAAYAFCDARLVGVDGDDFGGKSLLARRFTLASIRDAFDKQLELDLMLKRDFIYGTTLMFRAKVRDLVLPIPLSWSHDSWIANNLALRNYRGVPVLEPFVRYRQHGVQASGGTASPRNVRYAERARAYEDLRQALAAATDARPDALTRIDDKLRYLRAMVEMESAALPRRAAIALGEVASGRWSRYSPRTFLVDKRLSLSRFRG